MQYSEALNYINSKLVFGSKPGLERIGKFCEALGNPQDKLKFIHIAGTNGKGSTAAFLASVFTEAGHKTGLYTSPFIADFRERIQVDGKYISKKALGEITERVKQTDENMDEPATEFEIITAIAFEYFYSVGCDIVILETGLGGRFDATNIIENPLACVITSVSFDHMNVLGDTLEKIAFEKCGIIKSGSATVSYPKQYDAVLKVIKKACKEKNSKLFIPEAGITILESSLKGTTFEYKNKTYELSMLGKHQVYNAAVAIEAIEAVKDKIGVDDKAVFSGLKNAYMPARMEVMSHNPLVMVDGAHNENGIDNLIENMNYYFKDKRKIFVLGMLRDKEYEKAIKKVCKAADSLILTNPYSNRALPAAEAYWIAKKYKYDGDVSYNEAIPKAVKAALDKADEKSAVICCGSFYMSEEIKKSVKKFLRL